MGGEREGWGEREGGGGGGGGMMEATPVLLTLTHNSTVADLSTRLLELPEPLDKVPESRPCRNYIWSEYSHAVERRVLLLLCGYPPPHHLVFLQLASERERQQVLC